MKSILICNQKGGVGKTLLADELLYALEKDDIPYSFFDLDSQGGALHKQVENKSAQVQIIDTPGALQNDLLQWVKAADMIIVPTKMTLRDLPPLETMIDILKPFQGQKPILYVLNGWNRYSASKQFVDWFADTHSQLKFANLSQSEMFNTAAAANKSVCDIKANSVPAQQIRAIYAIVKYELQLKG